MANGTPQAPSTTPDAPVLGFSGARDQVRGFVEDGKIHLTDPSTGERSLLPVAQLNEALAAGLMPLSKQQVLRERFDDPGEAFVREAVPGANFLLRATGQMSPEEIEARRAANPLATGTGQFAQLAATLALTRGLGLPGAATKGAQALGITGRAASTIAPIFAEGLVAGTQVELAQLSGEKNVPLSEAAGRILTSAGRNAALATGFGIVAAGVGAGAAKFSRRLDKSLAKARSAEAAAATPAKDIQIFGPSGKVVSTVSRPLDDILPKGQRVKDVISSVDAEGRVIQQWYKTATVPVKKDLPGKLATLFSLKVNQVLRPLGPIGRALGGLIGNVGAEKIGANLARIVGKMSPLLTAGKSAVSIGPILPAVWDAFTEVEASQQKRLEVDYFSNAIDAIKTGVINADSKPSDLFLLSSNAATSKSGAKNIDPDAVLAAAKLQTPEQHRQAATSGYMAAGLPEPTAQQFGDFQARRISLLQSIKLDNPISRIRGLKMLDAVLDPGSSLKRIEDGSYTAEDLRVMNTLYPDAREAIATISDAVSEFKLRAPMTMDLRIKLQKLSTGRQRQNFRNLVQNIQQQHAVSAQKRQERPKQIQGLRQSPEDVTTSSQQQELGTF